MANTTAPLTIHKASAGSGKTYRLAYDYIRIAIGYYIRNNQRATTLGYDFTPFQQILAITFTNAATKEMKERIIAALNDIATCKADQKVDYLDELVKEYNVSRETVIDAADKLMRSILDNFSDFNISTIDSFFQNVLRTFAFDLDIIGNFGIELNDKELINASIAKLAQQTDVERLQRILWKMLENKVRDGKTYNIFNTGGKNSDWSDIVTFLCSEDYKAHRDEFTEYFGEENEKDNLDKFFDKLASVPAKVIKKIYTIADVLKNEYNFPGNSFAANAALPNYLIKITSTSEEDRQIEGDSNPALVYTVSVPNNIAVYTSLGINAKKKKSAPEFANADAIEDILKELGEQFKTLEAVKEIRKTNSLMHLIQYIIKNLNDLLNENNNVLLSNTNELIHKIIDNDETPYIYERLGTRLRHFLIDEFQDTSQMQWQNLKPLVEEGISSSNESLIIGDAKQSIYRFRNAEPELINTTVAEQFGAGARVTYGDGATPLSTNFRSANEIVRFNNRVFAGKNEYTKDGYNATEGNTTLPQHLDSEFGLDNVCQKVYSDAYQVSCERKGEGQVSITILDKNSDNDQDPTIQKVRTLIDDLLERGYKQSDIALLVNKNSEGATLINELMRTNSADKKFKLEFTSNESLLLKNSQSVQVIVNQLRMLETYIHEAQEQADNNKTKATTKRKNKTLAKLAIEVNRVRNEDNELTLEQAITKALANEDATEDFSTYFSEASSLGILIDKIISKNLSKSMIKNDIAFIQAFQDAVIDFCANHIPTLHNLLLWWDNVGESMSIASPEDINAIKVSTIHKSKGLAYPIVILPYVTWKFCQTSHLWLSRNDSAVTDFFAKLDINKELIPPLFCCAPKFTPTEELEQLIKQYTSKDIVDTLNKTYVGFTRAINEMHIITQTGTPPALYFSQIMGEENELIIGEPTVPQHKDNEELNSANVDDSDPYPIAAGDLLERIKAKPISYEENESYADNSRYAHQRRGNVYHSIMSMIIYEKDIEDAVERAALRGAITTAESEKMKAEIKSFIHQDATTKSWFADTNKVTVERDMIDKNGEIARSDRFITTPEGETIVIDYKFGDDHSHDGLYRRQVSNYMRLLKDAGYNVSPTGYIWYPLESTILEVKG